MYPLRIRWISSGGGELIYLLAPGPEGVAVESTYGTCATCPGAGTALSATGSLQAFRADPVNTATGSFVTHADDLAYPSAGIPLRLARTYNSADATSGPFGPGWSWNLGVRASVGADGSVTVTDEGGAQAVFTQEADGSFTPSAGFRSTLEAGPGGGYVLRNKAKDVFTFDPTGRLTQWTDRNGLGLGLSHTADRVTAATDSAGRTLTLAWGTGALADRIVGSTGVDGRNTSYTYADGRLASATDPDGAVVSYIYDDAGRLIEAVDLLGHSTFTNVYDATTGRITSQADALGKTTTFRWDGVTATTTDPLGNSTRDTYGGNVLTSTEDANRKRTVFTYDAALNRVSVTNPRRAVTSFGYDAVGNQTSRTSPLGHTETWAYDTEDRETEHVDGRGGVTTRTYDPATGRIATLTTPAGNRTSWTYRPDGLPASVTDPRGNRPGTTASDFTTVFGYDGDLNHTSTTSPLGAVITHGYDQAGRLTKVVDPRGNEAGCDCAEDYTTATAYDPLDRVLTVTSPTGGVASNTYDQVGRLTSRTDPAGVTVGYTYDPAGRVLTQTDTTGQVAITSTYDDAGRLKSQTSGEGEKTTWNYDPMGRMTYRTTPKGNVPGCNCVEANSWYYEYDQVGNLITTTDPKQSRTYTTFDYSDRLVRTVDGLGNEVIYDYDANGNQVSVTDAAGTTSTTYDADNRPTETTDALQRVTTFTYDPVGQVTQQTSPAGAVTTWTYDAESRVTTEVSPRGNEADCDCAADYTTAYAYDAAGNLLSTRDARGHTTTSAYDAQSNRVAMTDANNHTTRWTYDVASRLTGVQAPDAQPNQATALTYDTNGQLASHTTPTGAATTYAYDRSGRLVQEEKPSGRWTHTYDPNGNRTWTVTANGNATTTAGDGQITTTYDALDQPTKIDYSDTTPDVTYTYDAIGRTTRMVDGTGTRTYTYDALDRLTSTTTGSSTTAKTWAYTYLPDHSPATSTRPDGTTAAWTYDLDGNPEKVTLPAGDTTFEHDTDGNLLATTHANGTVETLAWDPTGNLTDISTTKNGTPLTGQAITRDPAGNPLQTTTTRAASQETRSYRYDANDRLQGICYSALTACTGAAAATQWWTYDRNGNRLTEKNGTGTGATTTYTYDTADRLTSRRTGTAAAVTATYDANGNQLTDGTTTNTYGLDNRLRTTRVGTGTTTTLLRNGDGLPTRSTTGTAVTNWDWDLNHEIPTLATATLGTTTSSYWHDHTGRALTTRDTTTTGIVTTDLTLAHDAIGSVTDLINTTGTITRAFDYTPYGTPRAAVGAPTPTGPTTALQYAGMLSTPAGYLTRDRLYTPGTGRWTGFDPVPWSTASPYDNAYTYVAHRPTVDIDPLGAMCNVNPFTASPNACGIYNTAANTLTGHNTAGVVGKPVADFFVNVGRGASGGLTDNIANTLSPGASSTVTSTGFVARAGQGVGLVGAFAVPGGGAARAGATGARAGGDDLVALYRHVSPDELADIQASGAFRSANGSMEGKWFAETSEHAQQWGDALNGGAGDIVTTNLPRDVADSLMRLEKLDGIGPARYAVDLERLNRVIDRIRVL
ncbi:DUF6531 domain-containing protein [Jannaschia sp. R86511]|uniref:DUF6531 domain-containing protein n=1 Tax=Jannaschia sp. R86511 TaxID=3093853 RepID=UPI0036D2A155